MMLGVHSAIRGAVRLLTERYAEFYEAYPKLVVTGGDMGVLEDDELVDVFEPDLELLGIGTACRAIATGDDED